MEFNCMRSWRNLSRRAAQAVVFTLAVTALGAITPAEAGTYYVAPGGSDGNPGSISSPWRTAGKAFRSLSAGDTVYFREGIYRVTEGLGSDLPTNATANSRVTIAGYPGETAVITSMRVVTNWTYEGSSVWSAPLNDPSSIYNIPNCSQDGVPLKLATSVASSGYQSSITGKGQWARNISEDGVGRLYVRTTDDSAPSGHAMEVAEFTNGNYSPSTITLSANSGRDYITLKNLSIQGGYYPVYIGTNHIEIIECKISNTFGDGVKVIGDLSGLDLWNAQYGLIQDCEIFNFGETGIDVTGGDDWVLYGNDIHNGVANRGYLPNQFYSEASGIMIKNSAINVVVEANYIHDIPMAGFGAITIGGGTDNSARGRYESENVVAKNNLISNVNGLWYVVLFQSSYKGRFVNNIVANCSLSGEGRTLMELYSANNTPNVNPVVKNNLFYGNVTPSNRLLAEDPWHAGVTQDLVADYNLIPPAATYRLFGSVYTVAQMKSRGYEVHSTTATPTFVDASIRDFRALNEQSPQVDAGGPAGGYDGLYDPYDTGEADYDGSDRTVDGDSNGSQYVDIGSFEYDGQSQPVPTYSLVLLAQDGDIAVSPAKASYLAGETVTLDAQPATGYVFSYWSGSISGSTDPVECVIESDMTVTAHFTPESLPSEPQEDPVAEEALVGHWEFEEESGVFIYDSSGAYNTGLLLNGVTRTSGYRGNAIAFDNEQAAAMVRMRSLDINAGTIALWAYPDGYPDVQHFLFGHTAANWKNRIQLYTISGKLALGLGKSHTTVTDICALPVQQWSHVALTWDGPDYAVYVNGIERASGSFVGFEEFNYSADIGNIGEASSRFYGWHGVIDDVRFYNQALHVEQINSLSGGMPQLTSYWPLDEMGGDVAADFCSPDNNAVLLGAPTWTVGLFDNALRFANADDALRVPTTGLNAQAGSVSLWARPTAIDSGHHYLLGHTTGLWGNRVQLYLDNGCLTVGMGDAHMTCGDSQPLALSFWHHIVLTWKNGQCALHLNGTLLAQGAYSGLTQLAPVADIGNNGTDLYLGQSFVGDIDDVRFYNQPLSSAEVSGLFTPYALTQGLAVHYTLDEQAGTTAADSSGNNADGLLINGPLWTPNSVLDGALQFYGDDDAVQVPTDGLSASAGTVALWAYVRGVFDNHHYLFGHATADPWQDRIQLYLYDGSLSVGLGDSHTTAVNIENLGMFLWHHIALTWDKGTFRVYVNGVVVSQGTYTGLDELAPLADIGNNGLELYRHQGFYGAIDEVRLYRRAISDTEVQNLHRSLGL